MTEDEILHRCGLHPGAEHLDLIRGLLAAQTELERQSQGSGDTEVMKLCCVQLFNAGVMCDVLTIWRAKFSSWDAFCSIDIQLLCGRGRLHRFLGGEAGGLVCRLLPRLMRVRATMATRVYRELTGGEQAVWDRFDASFGFRSSMRRFPAITEPTPSVAWSLSSRDDAEYGRLDRLVEIVHAGFTALAGERSILCLDWQHPCYQVWPSLIGPENIDPPGQPGWPLSPYPDGDRLASTRGPRQFQAVIDFCLPPRGPAGTMADMINRNESSVRR